MAGVKLKVVHFLRHTWATIGQEATGDIMAIQETGAWKDPSSVRIYAKFFKRRKKTTVKTIHAFMKSHA